MIDKDFRKKEKRRIRINLERGKIPDRVIGLVIVNISDRYCKNIYFSF